ncbi:MAG: sigma-70 family RNA polymerase sigma factor [Anaerolineae bacterium]
MSTDEALARRAQQGDRDAFLALYERYLDRVYRRVCSRVPPQYAEDVTQDIFMAVLRSLHQFKHHARFSTWLYTIVNRQIADFYRRGKWHSDPATVSLDAVEGKPLAGTEEHERGDERALLQGILAALPEHYQEIILMRFADGLTFNEIAEARGQSLEAVKSLYRRAIQAIRDAIGD